MHQWNGLRSNKEWKEPSEKHGGWWSWSNQQWEFVLERGHCQEVGRNCGKDEPFKSVHLRLWREANTAKAGEFRPFLDNGPQMIWLGGGLAFTFTADTKMEPAATDVTSGWPLNHRRVMSDIKMQTGGGCTKGCPSVCFSLLLISISMLFFLGTPALCIHMETTESHSEFSCEPIRLRMCQDLPYNTTFMPNLLHHYDQQTAALAMEVSFGDAACVWAMHILVCCRV